MIFNNNCGVIFVSRPFTIYKHNIHDIEYLFIYCKYNYIKNE